MLSKWVSLAVLLLILVTPTAWAESAEQAPSITYAVPQTSTGGYLARISLHTPEEVKQMLLRAETFIENIDQYPDFEPVTVILHGPELRVFDRRNYKEYKEIVGLAARLEAFNVINVQVCEVQMMRDGLQMSDFPAFVESVPYGPAEKERLLKRGYQYF